MQPIPNIQQQLDNHLFTTLDAMWGNDASGDNWIEDPDNNSKNKYAIVREYQTLQPNEVVHLVEGKTTTNLGVFIITNIRLIYTPIHILGKTFGVRYETIIYAAAPMERMQQIGGDRITYLMNKDFLTAITPAPFQINGLSVPFTIRTTESEFAQENVDVQRIIAVIEQSQLRRF